MYIVKIHIKNYKLLQDVCVHVNPDMNIFVGENDAGKSTLLEAISIILSGKLNGYAFNRQIKDNLFNMTARRNYIDSLASDPELPKIILEAYCEDGSADYKGTNNDFGEDVCGIRTVVEFDPQYESVYKAMLSSGDVKDIPVEFYRVNSMYFSGQPVIYKTSPIKAVFVDTTRKDYTGLVDRFVSENITEYLSEEDQVELSVAYRRVRAAFSESDTIEKLNQGIQNSDLLNERNIAIELREENLDEWKRQMSVSVDMVPFEQIGFGSQNLIKVELAIANSEDHVNVILMEEPENSLSHTNMTMLLHRISSSDNKQIFISTHSSYVANKLNLDRLLLVRRGYIVAFRELPAETIEYFEKLPGYDTLRFVLAEKVILVEGPTDDLIIQRAYKDKKGILPIEAGIDIIAVNSLAFKHYCNIAVIMKKTIAMVTDNDADVTGNIVSKYEEYANSGYIKLFYEKNEALRTIEPSVLSVNCGDDDQPTVLFKESISNNNSMMNRDYDEVLKFMSNNKTEWAMRVFNAEATICYPSYIEELLNEYC